MLSTIVIKIFLFLCIMVGLFLGLIFRLNRRLQDDVDESYLHDCLPPDRFLTKARQAGEASLRRKQRVSRASGLLAPV